MTVSSLPAQPLSASTSASSAARRWTCALLVCEAVTVTVPVFVLGAAIGFPGVLDAPAAVALGAFAGAREAATFGYELFTLSSLLYLPLAALLSRVLGPDSGLGRAATGLGIAAGLAQLLGFLRWLFLVPFLAGEFFDPAAGAAKRDTVALIYDSFNRWAGAAVGEHLGFVLLGSWMITLCVLAARARTLPLWLSVAGAFIGAAIFLSAFEQLLPAYGPLLAFLNFAANTVWVFWLLIVAIFLARSAAKRPARAA